MIVFQNESPILPAVGLMQNMKMNKFLPLLYALAKGGNLEMEMKYTIVLMESGATLIPDPARC